ncbi:MAG: sulfurtransferase TusA family protein [Rhodospirillales bacterium]
MTKPGETPDEAIDITGHLCPMTFVRTKLAIEALNVGQVLEVRLKGAEPLDNVPRNAREHGHEVLRCEAEPGEGETGVHRLLIRKA